MAAAAFLSAAAGAASNPLVGTWRLENQEVDGQKSSAQQLTLKVTESGDQLAFAFSVPVHNVYFVSMSYTVRLDGSEGDVRNSNGEKVGTVEMSPAGAGQYKLRLKGPNRPDSTGKLIISADGKTLTSETDSIGSSGRTIHSRQTFSRE